MGGNAGVGISRLGSDLGPSGDQREIARIGLTILANTEHNNQFIRVQQINRPLEWLLRGQAIGPDLMRSTHRVPPPVERLFVVDTTLHIHCVNKTCGIGWQPLSADQPIKSDGCYSLWHPECLGIPSGITTPSGCKLAQDAKLRSRRVICTYVAPSYFGQTSLLVWAGSLANALSRFPGRPSFNGVSINVTTGLKISRTTCR